MPFAYSLWHPMRRPKPIPPHCPLPHSLFRSNSLSTIKKPTSSSVVLQRLYGLQWTHVRVIWHDRSSIRDV